MYTLKSQHTTGGHDFLSPFQQNKNKRIVKDNNNVQHNETKSVLDIKLERPKKARSFLPLNKSVKIHIGIFITSDLLEQKSGKTPEMSLQIKFCNFLVMTPCGSAGV